MANEIKNNKVETIKNNSEILFIYEAKMTNPNGDPDDENKPRMDYDRNLNLVSDVRLKRYIRDYIEKYVKDDNHLPLDIFVSKIDGATVDSTKRLKLLIEKYKAKIIEDEKLKELMSGNNANEKKLSKHLNWLLSKLIDVRFFGATMPIKAGDTGKGASITFTGPIQLNWGYSLNKVEGVIDSNTITSTFGGATEDQSTMGKDYRVGYSIIAFHGIISAKRAEHTNLTDSDIDIFDDAIIKAIPFEATTRSKMGQTPLLYLRVEYNSPEFFIGDLRRYVKLVTKENKEIPFDESSKLDWDKYNLDISKLKTKLEKIHDKISKIHFWKNEDIKVEGWKVNGIKVIELPKEEKTNNQNE